MNTVKLSGTISSGIRLTTNAKKGCPQVDFLLDVPFSHPYVQVSDGYRTKLRTYVMGDHAEWIYDNLAEGDHLEIKHGFIQTWYVAKQRRTFYRILGQTIDRDRSGVVPSDYEPTNIARISGVFRKQWTRNITEDGTLKVGISVAASPDIKTVPTNYETILSVLLYDDLAEIVDGNMERGDRFDLIEGVMQTWRGTMRTSYALYIHATDIRI